MPFIYIISMLQMLAWSIITPILPLYVSALGGTAVTVGIVTATVALPTLFFGLPLGRLIDRHGAEKGILAGSLLLAFMLGLLVTNPSIILTAAAIGTAGLSQVGLSIACQAVIARQPTRSRKVQQFGHLSLFTAAGMLLGPLLAGFLLDGFGFQAVFLGTVLTAALCVPLAFCSPWTKKSHINVTAAPTEGLSRTAVKLLRDPKVAIATLMAFVIIFAFSLRTSFLPIYLTSLGLPAILMGTLLSVQSLASMLIRPFIGWAVRILGYYHLFIAAFGLAIIGTFLIPIAPTLPVLFIASILVGIAMGFIQPLTMTMFAEAHSDRGLALGLRMTVQRLGHLVGPLLFGGVVAVFGLASAFFAATAILVLGTGLTARYGQTLKDETPPDKSTTPRRRSAEGRAASSNLR